MRRTSPLRLVLLTGLVVVAAACGKKGPPLPPLHPAPDKVTSISVIRRADEVTISFLTPIRNGDGSVPFLFDRVEIYALTVPAGTIPPTLKKVFVPANRIAVLGQKPPVPKPAVVPGAVPTATPPEQDDAPVAIPLMFTEKVGIPPAPVVPVVPASKKITLAPLPINLAQIPGTTATPATAAVPSAVLPLPTRFYLIVPYANRTRVGTTEIFGVSLIAGPPPPTKAEIKYDEQTLTLTWVAGQTGIPVQVYDGSPTAAAGAKPLNTAPLTVLEYKRPVVFGTEVCLVVRSVSGTAPMLFESAPSNVACVKPVDSFPPPAPTGLIAFATEGSIALTWEPVTATDLAGYLILRTDGTGETLQPLSTTPVTGTTFTDTTARAGVKYTYAVVAIDTAKPGNRSKESNRVEETGR